ncbi:MAG: HEAT repeat domain-containing protein [Gemmatimonadetes bacterium]|nr:HEAT repeat domain-containing protein [Gemmatimonadota bacterium]
MPTRNPHLLRDDAICRFITDGYVQVNAGLPAEFHRNLYRKIEIVLEEEGNPGNNILPRIPEIHRVFDQPSVRGALTSLLGPGYLMHPHRYCHLNKPGSSGQQWHKDDYIFDHNVRHARCRWVMAFYYPQDVSADMGPTGILPGMQHHNGISDCDASRTGESALGLCGSAGTVSIVNFDSWHRATPNVSKKNRYMLKFQFTRSREPAGPAWESGNGRWKPQPGDALPAVSEAVWSWLAGGERGEDEAKGVSIDRCLAGLDDADERVRLQAAYTLGRKGDDAVEPLVEHLCATREEEALANVPRNPANPAGGNPSELPAAYALSSVGRPAVKGLEALLEDDVWWVRAAAADVLGDIGLPASSVRPALLRALGDEEAWVRRNASEALAVIGGFSDDDAPALRGAIGDEDERVRRNTAFALARHPIQAADLFDDLVARSLEDEGRYVRYYAMAAAARMTAGTDRDGFVDAMLAARWCPLTTRKSAF